MKQNIRNFVYKILNYCCTGYEILNILIAQNFSAYKINFTRKYLVNLYCVIKFKFRNKKNNVFYANKI